MQPALSPIIVHATASQWQLWEDFARFLKERDPEIDPERAAERYARYWFDLRDERWQEIKDYRSDQPDGTVALPDLRPCLDDALDVHGTALMAHSLFAFAARYIGRAWSQVALFLRGRHGFDTEDWNAIMNYLDAQEEGLVQ